MNLDKLLYQKSYLYFIGFFLFAIAAFWLTYFTKLFDQENYRLHAHGVAMILWCMMLISQAYLIRTKRFTLHKLIGKFSYLLVPLIVFTTVDLLAYRFRNHNSLGTMDYYFIALVLNALVAFIFYYGLAILNRRRPVLHARFMICTVFPMFTPVTDRLIFIYFDFLVPYLPTLEGNPIAPVVGFLMADLILVGLCIWDWKISKRWNVFPVVLLVLLMYHYSVLNFHKFEFWKSFCLWFMNL